RLRDRRSGGEGWAVDALARLAARAGHGATIRALPRARRRPGARDVLPPTLDIDTTPSNGRVDREQRLVRSRQGAQISRPSPLRQPPPKPGRCERSASCATPAPEPPPAPPTGGP